MAFLAVDVGTSLIKSVVFDEEGREAAVARVTTEVLRPSPDRVEQDMDAVWAGVVRTVREAVAAADLPVRAMSVTAQGDGCWLVDAQGRPTGPAMLWSDGRAVDIVEHWRSSGVLAEAFRASGSLTFAGLPNALLAWLAEHDPERLERSAKALYCGGWVFLRLTGRAAVDEADASAPFLDPVTRTYSDRSLDLFGLDWARPLLPEVLPDDGRAAELSPVGAAETGLPTGLPVVLAPYDVAATAIGTGTVRDGQACTILGTTLCTEVVRAAPDTSGEPAGLTVALGPDSVLRAFPTLAGTGVLTWAADLLGVADPIALGALAQQAAPGSGGLVFLPYLSPSGERAPFLDPTARGTWWGLTLGHGRAEMARSVFEGLSFVVRDCLEVAVAGGAGPVSELRLCGGGANSESWQQLIADVTGAPAVRSTDTEVGAKGAMLCGLVALGDHPDLASAAAASVRVRDVCEPHPATARYYDDLFARFLALREAAGEGWRHMAATPPAAMRPS